MEEQLTTRQIVALEILKTKITPSTTDYDIQLAIHDSLRLADIFLEKK